RNRLHRHDDGPPLLKAVHYRLHVLKADGLLHHDAQPLSVRRTARTGQAHQAPLAGGHRFRTGLGHGRGRLLNGGCLFLLNAQEAKHPVHKAPAAAVLVHAGLGPNSAEPIRTIVEPSSTATSKSLLIPIESHSMLTPRMPASATCSASRRSSRKTGRTVSGSSVHGAMVIKPRTARPGSSATVRTKGNTSA